ncbi:MAG TPA: hypothetical protein PLB88_08525 [Thermoanaerobaculaceae bacterium]|nr:hypothetical protein [Thermoanaerobaculaceae bacterium]
MKQQSAEVVFPFDPAFAKTATEAAEVYVVPRLRLRLVKQRFTRRVVSPGRMVLVEMEVTRLAEPLPPGIATEEDVLERICADRGVTGTAKGFFWSTKNFPARCDPNTSASHLTAFAGTSVGGTPLAPDVFFAEVKAAVDDGTFTAEEFATFSKDPRIIAALRKGALDHVDGWLQALDVTAQGNALAVLAKRDVVPGFAAVGGGRESFLEYLALPVKKADGPALLALVAKIKGVAS